MIPSLSRRHAGDTPSTPLDIPTPPASIVADIVTRALAEDLTGAGDLTSDTVVPLDAHLDVVIAARAPGRICGVQAAQEVFRQVDPRITVSVQVKDGANVTALTPVLRISGPARTVLTAERTALNFLTHLSGVATLTQAYVKAIDGTLARIVGTRKTTPGLRTLENHAICCGGGGRHRYNLSDAILVKDNHIAAAGGVTAALMAVRARAGHMAHVSIEVDTISQLEEALRYGPDVVLLDNFDVKDMTEAVRMAGGRCVVEASGGVSLETVRQIAETGVDVISIGALTHSAPALDLGMDVV